MTENEENTDTQEAISPANQCEQIREQLQQIPDNPSPGDVAAAADMLTDARELAEEQPGTAWVPTHPQV